MVIGGWMPGRIAGVLDGVWCAVKSESASNSRGSMLCVLCVRCFLSSGGCGMEGGGWVGDGGWGGGGSRGTRLCAPVIIISGIPPRKYSFTHYVPSPVNGNHSPSKEVSEISFIVQAPDRNGAVIIRYLNVCTSTTYRYPRYSRARGFKRTRR